MSAPGKHNLTGYECALCEEPPNEESQMVFCEKCQGFFHLQCAGVTEANKDLSFTCKKCTGLGDTVDQTGDEDDGATVVDGSKKVDETLPGKPNPSVINKPDGSTEQEDAELQHRLEMQQLQEAFQNQLHAGAKGGAGCRFEPAEK
ncbi:hypothetical protein pipiens_016874 [Culex pipiens pipiens]|uniref:PHD-type domain-containing protein n=1 Tax=Culex pipiens pipiens TaxID=38569 RepID=A0ABD1CJA2_CULPP